MVQIIPQEEGLGEILAGSLGRGLGGGVSSGLQMLMEAKMKGLVEQQKMNSIRSLIRGADQPGADTEVDFLDESVETRSPGARSELSDEQILGVSAIDPQMGRVLQSQKKLSSTERIAQFKETKELRKDISKQNKAAKDNELRLDKMQQLNDKGKLIDPTFNEVLGKFGLSLNALRNPDSEEFQKLSTDMIRNIREIFGGRITNIELETFLKTIPTLNNTSEGKNRIIKNLKIMNQGAGIRAQAMRDIIKENRGTPPFDLEERIEERIEPQLDELKNEFLNLEPISTKPIEEAVVEKSEVIMIDPQGRRRAVSKKDAKAAQQAGYKVFK